MPVSPSLSSLPDLLGALHVQRPLLVCSARWADALHGLCPDAPVFSAFSANPDFDQCAAGLCMLERCACDGVVAMGGGSAMDTAKTIKAMFLSPSPARALEMRYSEGTLPLICIPTTAGSGSEATQTAVVYVDNRKFSLSHPCLLPDGVILDPAPLRTLPFAQKRSCALDALCQAIESYWSKSATEESRALASEAISGIFPLLPAYLSGDSAAAGPMLTLSHRAGQAIQLTRTTAAHAMSYQLTKLLGIPHGDACALTLPFLWLRLAEKSHPACLSLAALLGFSDPADPACLFLGMRLAFHLPAPGLPSDETMERLVRSVNPERLGNHPEVLTGEEIRDIYTFALRQDETAIDPTHALEMWNAYVQHL